MAVLRTIILLSAVLFTSELSASSKLEEFFFKETKKIKILLESSIFQAKTQAGWLWFEPEVHGFLKNIIKTGNQLDLNNPSSFFESHITPSLNKNTLSWRMLSPQHFKSLLILKTTGLDPVQKYLLIRREQGNFASVYFQTQGFQIPLGYPHKSTIRLLDLIDTHYNLVAKKILLPELNKEMSVFLLRSPYAEKITSSGFQVLSAHLEKCHQRELWLETNYHLSNWYDFKNIQFTEKYFNFLVQHLDKDKTHSNREVLNIIDLGRSLSTEISHAHSRWESVLGLPHNLQIEQK